MEYYKDIKKLIENLYYKEKNNSLQLQLYYLFQLVGKNIFNLKNFFLMIYRE